MKKTTKEQLENVRIAIQTIENGADQCQLKTTNGFRVFNYDNLDQLYDIEERLLVRLRKEQEE